MATPALTPNNYYATTLTSTIGTSDTTIYLNGALPGGNEGYLEIDEGLSSKEIVKYTSKGANFVTLTSAVDGRGLGGTSASAHSSGATVKQKLNAEWWKALQDGSALTWSAVPNNLVPANALATTAITLGYAQATANQNTSSVSVVQVTGLSATATIPAGGRKIKITAFISGVNASVAGVNTLTIWDGTVGSGTLIQEAVLYIAGASQYTSMTAIAVVTPAAGSKTYNIGFQVPGGTTTLNMASTNPSFILVEAI